MSGIREKILWSCADRLLGKSKPYVIAIGGGIAKTSTKVALGNILKSSFPNQVLVGFGNLNTLIGVPLSILSFEIDFHKQKLSYINWLVIFIKAIWRSYFSRLPRYLVLEYGTDKPGDIKELVSRLRPDMALITVITSAHIGNYKNMEEIVDDEAALAQAIAKDGIVLINSSDKRILSRLKSITAEKVIKVDTSLEEIAQNFAVAATTELGVPKESAEEVLKAGIKAGNRFDIITLKKYTLIDDSYNANLDSMKAALSILSKSSGRKVAILGSMLELGDHSVNIHQEVGEAVHKIADLVIGVGPDSEYYRPSFKFDSSQEAADYIFNPESEGFPLLQERDSILVKGSRGIKMEKIAERIKENGV